MRCQLCSGEEIQFNPSTNEFVHSKHPKDVTSIICSNCLQLILVSIQDQLKQAYQIALEKGFIDKAKALETFLGEEINYGETKKLKRDMGRERIVRTAQLTHQTIRQKRAVR